jgi:hypothetical protein
MFKFLCHNLGTPENSQIQAHYREEAGHTKPNDRTCWFASCRSQRLFVTGFLRLLTVLMSPPVGQLDQGRLWLWQLGLRPLAPSGCGRRLSGQGACLTLSLLVDDMEVSGHVQMVGSVVHVHSRLTSCCGAHLFCPQISKYVKAVLIQASLSHVQHLFPLTRNP